VRTSTSKVRIEARPKTVWAALTDSEHVKRWQYGSVLRTSWTVGSPIRFTSEWEGQTFEQWGTVLEFEPPTQLRYSLFAPRPGLEDRPENYFTMTYTLQAEGAVTVLTITQEDPREPPTDQPADDEVSEDEENPILDALKKLAESMEQSAPEE
jgi:uncharacterized protein YndB with AHSA1/START domain